MQQLVKNVPIVPPSPQITQRSQTPDLIGLREVTDLLHLLYGKPSKNSGKQFGFTKLFPIIFFEGFSNQTLTNFHKLIRCNAMVIFKELKLNVFFLQLERIFNLSHCDVQSMFSQNTHTRLSLILVTCHLVKYCPLLDS